MTSAYPIINQLKMYLSQTNYKQWPGEYGMEKVEEAVEMMQEMQQKIERLEKVLEAARKVELGYDNDTDCPFCSFDELQEAIAEAEDE